MNRSIDLSRPWLPLPRQWLGAALALMLAIGTGLLIADALLSPPAGDMRSLTVYLTIAGGATLAVGWLAVRVADRAIGLSIQTKSFLGAAISNGIALVNVFIVAQFMFVSTSHDLKLLVALLVFSGVVTAFFSLWVASTVAGRVETIAGAVRRIAAGNYATTVTVSGGDQVSRLAADVNLLAERLHASEELRQTVDRERRELTAAISHDLRTPLASVRAMVEALDDRVVDDGAEIERYYATMRREIERLSRMIDDLFELAQIDAGALRLDRQPVALDEVAAEVVDAMQAQARRGGVSLELRVDADPPEALLDGTRIERAVANLVRNALEHTPSGGRVDVDVFAERGWVGLRVADSGDGIDAADLPHIWTRFYRAEKSRRRAPGADDGAGLGLAITRGIVESHGGQIDVQSSPGCGAAFVVRLPAA